MPTVDSQPFIKVRGRSFMALVLAPEPPVQAWLDALDGQIARSPSFFEGRPVVLDLAALPREQPDVAGLLLGLGARGVRIIGTEGAHPSWQGLEAWAPLHANTTRPARPVEVPDERRSTASATIAQQEANALLIDHPVRSGQSVVYDQGDVTIIGSVASGAEVIAGGSIHVYGALRGRAIAGLTGNNRARIFCRKLEAELLAIDGVYQTADDMNTTLRGKPVQAWLTGEAMMLATLD
ncbi:MAG TPA: septum site-determining protein MinC [Acetobacteraceae bacterium]|nr:septum site-determining protein MinC [Acetobacteraceae bacterium]